MNSTPFISYRTLMLACLVGAASSSGCGFLRRLAGNDTIDLKKAEIETMTADIRREKKSICPREPVQMAIFAKVKLESGKPSQNLETWAGKGSVNKNDKMDFEDFVFQSPQGPIDKDGWFTPPTNLLATVDKEMEIKSTFKQRPEKFTFTNRYKPDYTCITSGGGSGIAGPQGHSGDSGSQGSSGQNANGGVGGNGGSGGAGGPGSNGGDGQPGPRIEAFATIVKTPFYERLIAIRVGGDREDFLLVPEGQRFTLRAAGGNGGAGGQGGHGGAGGGGGSGFVGGNGGQGGPGGNGGQGGNGGLGGTVELTIDSRFPELANAIRLEAPGGAGGTNGMAGDGGSAGSSGSCSGQQCRNGSMGSSGPRGAGGTDGRRGPDGRVAVRMGSVADKFAGAAGVTVLGAGPAPIAETPSVPTAKDDEKKGKPRAKKKKNP